MGVWQSGSPSQHMLLQQCSHLFESWPISTSCQQESYAHLLHFSDWLNWSMYIILLAHLLHKWLSFGSVFDRLNLLEVCFTIWPIPVVALFTKDLYVSCRCVQIFPFRESPVNELCSLCSQCLLHCSCFFKYGSLPVDILQSFS